MMSSSEHADTNHRGYSHMDPEYPECDPCETNASDGMLTQENEEMQERVIALEKKVQAQEDEIMCLKSALSDVIRRLQAVESGRGVQNNILPSMPKMGSGSQNSPRRMPMTARSAAPSTRRAMSAEHVSSVQRYSSPTPNRIVPRNHPGGGAGGGGGGGASAGGGGSSRKWTSSPSVNEAMNGHMSPGSPAQLSPVSPMAPSTPTGAAPTSISVSPAPSLTSLTPLSPAYSGEQRASVRRSGSLSSLTGRMSPSPFTIRYKEPIYNPDDKCLRMFLRGRAVNMYAPSSLEDYQVGKPLDAPTQKLRLEWVYGYRGRDARSNLYLLPTGEIVYFVAAVVVLYNVEEQMQRHYLGHNDDVKCLALHPDRLRIATGQVAGHDKKEGRKKSAKDIEMLENAENWWHSPSSRKRDRHNQPHIRIWNSVNLQTLKVIGLGEFDRAVSCLAFSKADGGQFLAAVDEANEHVLSLWDWEKGEKGHKVTETKSSTEPVLAIEFHPCEKNIIVTCGKGQLSFWNMEGSMLTRKMGIYERFEKPKFVTCLAFAENGDTITGDSNGNIFVWGRDEVEEGTNKITHSMIGAHEGGIFSVCVMKNGLILTGGKDRRIVQWDNNYKKTGQEHELPEMYGPVRMLSQGKGNMVLVGTTKNSILQGSLDFKFSTIVQGHVDELWGLAVHPSQHQFVSTGYDRNLYVWDALTHTTVWCKELPDGAHCACFHPDGGIIVVGTLCGRWLVMDNTAHDIITTHTDGSEILGAMAFSPDGRLLAIGSRDNNIYIYGVSEGGRKYIKNGKCSGHSSFITHLDWSLDSQWLQSNSGDYEILFWNPETCRQVTAASTLRDVEWSSHSCTLGFNVAGIWPEGADGTDVNACARSNKKHLVASADDFGKVNLYTYPCSQPKSTATIYNGHSSHVTNVNFLCDDSRLLSTGGKDTAILQWEVMD